MTRRRDSTPPIHVSAPSLSTRQPANAELCRRWGSAVPFTRSLHNARATLLSQLPSVHREPFIIFPPFKTLGASVPWHGCHLQISAGPTLKSDGQCGGVPLRRRRRHRDPRPRSDLGGEGWAPCRSRTRARCVTSPLPPALLVSWHTPSFSAYSSTSYHPRHPQSGNTLEQEPHCYTATRLRC